MSEHKISLNWRKQGDFSHEGFERQHQVMVSDQTINMAGANTPGFVDPEQGLTFSLASCHMLTFLALAAKKRLVVAEYTDEAVGVLGQNQDGKSFVERIILRPNVVFEGKAPEHSALLKMHDKAHEHCFIANSVLSKVEIEVSET